MSLSHNNSIYLFISIMKEPIFCRTKWKTEIQFPVNHLTSSYPVTTLETWISWHLFVGLLKCYCGRVGLLFFHLSYVFLQFLWKCLQQCSKLLHVKLWSLIVPSTHTNCHCSISSHLYLKLHYHTYHTDA